MSAVRHILCFRCGGQVGYNDLNRVVTCSFCDARMFVDNPDWTAEYRFAPAVDALTARRALQRFLTDPALPAGILRQSRFKTAELCWVPFNDVRVRRLGAMEFSVEKTTAPEGEWGQPTALGRFSLGGANADLYEPERRYTGVHQKQTIRETTVIVGDIHRIEPAVALSDMGIEFTAAERLLKQNEVPVQRFDRMAAARGGTIMHPTIPPKDLIARISDTGRSALRNDQTTFVEARTRRVYYPVWRLRYGWDGREYTAAVDAVTGDLLFARAPENETRRTLVLLFLLALFGFFTGRGLHHYLIDRTISVTGQTGSNAVNLGAYWLIPLFVLAVVALLTISAGWSAIRYPAEIVQRGPKKSIERTRSSVGRIWHLLDRLVDPDNAMGDSPSRGSQ